MISFSEANVLTRSLYIYIDIDKKKMANGNGRFDVHSYYVALKGPGDACFPLEKHLVFEAFKKGCILCIDNSLEKDSYM